MSEARTLRDRGRDLSVESWVEDGRNYTRLLVDGVEQVRGDTDPLGEVKLVADDLAVRVTFWWRGRIRSCDLFDQPVLSPDGEETETDQPFPSQLFSRSAVKVPFAPPPGSRAARAHVWRETHPRLWATRHVAIQIASILAVVLGISALLSAIINRLVPAIDWGWLPSFSAPEWLKYLNPSYWIGRLLPDWDWFGWVPDVDIPDLGWVKYVVLLALAVGTGVREVRKRRERESREQD